MSKPLFTPQFENKLKTLFPYEIDDFQRSSISSIEENHNVLVTAHTGAGKSTIAEYTIFKYLEEGKKVIYTSPIKTLSNQKYGDFTKMFGIDNIGLITGDIKLNEEAQCIIMTTEILRNQIFSEKIENLGAIIFDEVHYFNDKSRGYIWEECITFIDPSVQLIMLSATFTNANSFAHWIEDIKKVKTDVHGTTFRPVPLLFMGWNEKSFPLMTDKQDINIEGIKDFYQSFKQLQDPSKKIKNKPFSEKFKLNQFIGYIIKKEQLPLLSFSFSRKKCIDFAKSIELTLNDHIDNKEIMKIYNSIFNKDLAYMREKEYLVEILELVKKGVGYHHSGLLPLIKEFIEILFNRNLIKILFATETFAVGVNTSTRSVCFNEVEKYDGIQRFLRNDEFIQMSGRAGRRGKDTIGYVYYVPLKEPVNQFDLKGVLIGSGKIINSQLKISSSKFLQYINDNYLLNDTFFSRELISSKKTIEKNIDKLKESVKEPQLFLTKEENEFMEQYEELCLKNGKGKNGKKIAVQKNKMENEMTKNIRRFYDYRKNILTTKDKINNLEKELRDIDHLIDTIIKSGRIYLRDFIDKPEAQIISKLNYQNEILLANLIVKIENPIYFISILSMFIDEKGKVDINTIKGEMPKEFLIYFNEIVQKHNDYRDKYAIQDPYLDIYREDLYFDLIIPTYLWLEGSNLNDIGFYYDGYIGNFIRNIMQINEILEKVISIREEMGLETNELVLTQKKLIRDEAIFNSVYLRTNSVF